jgi:hypothetical protein
MGENGQKTNLTPFSNTTLESFVNSIDFSLGFREIDNWQIFELKSLNKYKIGSFVCVCVCVTNGQFDFIFNFGMKTSLKLINFGAGDMNFL